MICAAQKHCTKVPYYRPRCGPPVPMSLFFFPSCNEFRNLKTQTIPSSCAREYICEQPVFVKKSTD